MAYIYEIINDINGKSYIGKTQFSIQKRFKEHCRDSKKERNQKRPLYAAMRKYGIEHFHIYLIEKTDDPEEREKYWIQKKGTFKNGYNATIGGDGKKYLDYDILITAYKESQNLSQVCKKHHCSKKYLSTILKANGVSVISSQQIAKRNLSKSVNQYTLNGEYIKTFSSITEAANNLGNKDYRQHIGKVCKGKRKTAYGYKWKYAE